MLVSGMGLMMPVMLLSGLIFPVESMPLPLQCLSAIVPARWYVDAIRKIMIQGAEIQFVLKEIGILPEGDRNTAFCHSGPSGIESENIQEPFKLKCLC